MPHEIRLAGPWEQCAEGGEWGRCKLPWSAADMAQPVVMRRKFHRPTGIDERSTLSLVFDASAAVTRVSLNAESLSNGIASERVQPGGKPSGIQTVVDVTKVLREFNTLEISVSDRQLTLNQVKLRIDDNNG